MDDLIVARADGVARLTLNRPQKKNALSIALRDAISDALDEIATDESLKCVVFTGAGNVFCAGFDLSEFPRSFEDEEYSNLLWASSDRYHHAVYECPVPTIAAVNGPALAGGFDLAVMCDIRVATTNAGFAHPEFTFGDVVYGPLHDLVGGAVARDLCLTGRGMTAEEALRVNLVSAVVAEDALAAAVDEIVARIVQAPRELLMRTKAKANARARIASDTGTLDL
jgi:enoyl-CoA hydratase